MAITPHICVIGGGAGGQAMATLAAARGVPVVLIEQNALGGERLAAAVPWNAVLTELRHRAHREVGGLGMPATRAAIEFRGMMAHAREVAAQMAPDHGRERLTGLGIRVVLGTARFGDPETVLVDAPEGSIEIKAKHFVIATGSVPTPPPIPGLRQTPCLTARTVFELETCPAHLILIGAGFVGLEFAQAFRRLGAQVTVVDGAEPMAGEDPECAAAVLQRLDRDGIVIRSEVAVTRVAAAESGVQVVIAGPSGEEAIAGSHLLLLAARPPNVDGLGLDAARIKHDRTGIEVDPSLVTSNPRVYAIGDVIGGSPSVHAAVHQAELVVRHALTGVHTRYDPLLVPRVLRTDPEFAQVGQTEAQLRQRGRPFRVLRWPCSESDRARIDGKPAGHIKVLTSPRGRLLGVTLVGEGACDQIVVWALGIANRLDISAYAGMIVPYPGLGDIGKSAAATYLMPGSARSWVRRLRAVLRRFG
jgi:pyruvate/2-oxoglutarate dehydrogenase complex dihydrolipoamide dehydrogenase (E3) component